MPRALLAVMCLQPTHYYMDVVFGILLKGAGFRILWGSILPMCAIGGIIFVAAVLSFRRQMR